MRYWRARRGGEIARSRHREPGPWASRAAGPAADGVRPGEPRHWGRLASPPSKTRRVFAEKAAHADDRRQSPARGRTVRGRLRVAPSIRPGRFQDRAAAAGWHAAVSEGSGTGRHQAAENASSGAETAP